MGTLKMGSEHRLISPVLLLPEILNKQQFPGYGPVIVGHWEFLTFNMGYCRNKAARSREKQAEVKKTVQATRRGEVWAEGESSWVSKGQRQAPPSPAAAQHQPLGGRQTDRAGLCLLDPPSARGVPRQGTGAKWRLADPVPRVPFPMGVLQA